MEYDSITFFICLSHSIRTFFLFERVHRKAKTGLDADRFDLVQSKLLFFLLKKRKRIAAVSIKNLMPALKFETTAAAANNNRRPFSFVCFFLFRFRFQWPNPIAADAILLSQTTYDDYRSTKRRSRFSLGQFFCFFFREGVTLKKEEIESSAAAIVKQSVT